MNQNLTENSKFNFGEIESLRNGCFNDYLNDFISCFFFSFLNNFFYFFFGIFENVFVKIYRVKKLESTGSEYSKVPIPS